MSYRLIDSNAIADKYPEVNDMPCVFADLPNGLDGRFIDAHPMKRGRWESYYIGGDDLECIECSECGEVYDSLPSYNYCPNCGAKMEGDND